MSNEETRTGKAVDEIQAQLPPDHALLLAAFRAEFDAKLQANFARLQVRLLMFGIPLGAVGGFTAELVRPGSVGEAVAALPWL